MIDQVIALIERIFDWLLSPWGARIIAWISLGGAIYLLIRGRQNVIFAILLYVIAFVFAYAPAIKALIEGVLK